MKKWEKLYPPIVWKKRGIILKRKLQLTPEDENTSMNGTIKHNLKPHSLKIRLIILAIENHIAAYIK